VNFVVLEIFLWHVPTVVVGMILPMRTLIPAASLVVLALLAPAVAAGARQDKPADVAGIWAITIEDGGNTRGPFVTFRQDGETLTGRYASQIFGEQQVTGTIKGNAITFSFTGKVEGKGDTVKVIYTATVDKTTMKGTVTIGDLGEGAFTAKKQ